MMVQVVYDVMVLGLSVKAARGLWCQGTFQSRADHTAQLACLNKEYKG